MDRCDYCSVMQIIRRFTLESREFNQLTFIEELFSDCVKKDEDNQIELDFALVCRWSNGAARISPRISTFYHDPDNQKKLLNSVRYWLLPQMFDIGMALQELHDLVTLDPSISEREKKRLMRGYPSKTDADDTQIITSVLCFGMTREFVKREQKGQKLLPMGRKSPLLDDYILLNSATKPCRTFCGRESEIAALHIMLTEHQKVFLYGIAGIGKSEVAKAYAWQHRKEYTNVLHLFYGGSLQQMIAEMDFIDDQPDDTEEERFRRHNRFLRTLQDDTLLIIDNFNAAADRDELLPVVIKYRCRILFTTRSKFTQYTSMELQEMEDYGVLQEFVGKFYRGATQQPELVHDVVMAVHSHTFAVEIAARLMESGILEPQALLEKLQAENVRLATDSVGVHKDGSTRKATYYGHLHTLFSLYLLSEGQQDILRSLSLVPLSGIRDRLFAMWMELANMDGINSLEEAGFLQRTGSTITLHPMVQEMAVADTKPSMKRCNPMLHNINLLCRSKGYDIHYYKVMFRTIENFVRLAENDDMEAYLLFLEDAFTYMDNYHYQRGLMTVKNHLEKILSDSSVGGARDRALLYDSQATYEERYNHNVEKALHYQKKAVAALPEVTADNALMCANLHANLGALYHCNQKYELAIEQLEIAGNLFEEYNLTHTHDIIAYSCTYANILTTMGKPEPAFAALKKCEKMIKSTQSTYCNDYAMVQETMGVMGLQIMDYSVAQEHFQKSLDAYDAMYGDSPEVIEDYRQHLLSHYSALGTNIGKLIVKKMRAKKAQ